MSFLEEPQSDKLGQAYRDILDYDPALVFMWHGLEDPERGEHAHWILYRRQDEKSQHVAEEIRASGIMTMAREEREEFTHVLDWTESDGSYRPIDGRLLAELVKRDPLQHGRNVLEGKRKQDEQNRKRREAAKRSQDTQIQDDHGVVSDQVLSYASDGHCSGERNMQGRGYGGRPAPYFDEREESSDG